MDYITQLIFSLLSSTYLLPYLQKEEEKAQGAHSAATPKKRAKKTTSNRQAPVILPLVFENSLELDNSEGGRKATDMNGLDGMMDILIDISSYCEATG